MKLKKRGEKKNQFGRVTGVMFAAAVFLGACGNLPESGDFPDMADLDAGAPEVTAGFSAFGTENVLQAETVGSRGGEVMALSGAQSGQVIPASEQQNTAVLSAAAQAAENDKLPIDEAHFPDAAFREYIKTYIDKNKNGSLSQRERDAVLGLGSVECEGGLSDGNLFSGRNLERGRMLREIRSLEGIEYFGNLEEVCFEGAYALQKLPLDNPKLTSVQVNISSLPEFSIRNAGELISLNYRTAGGENIAWETLKKLEELTAVDSDLSIKELSSCKNLQTISLTGGSLDMTGMSEVLFEKMAKLSLTGCHVFVPKQQETIDFIQFPNLREFYYSPAKDSGDGFLAKELNFKNNRILKQVVFDTKAADRIVLPEMDVYFAMEEGLADCEVIFAEELLLDVKKTLPEGCIWLTAQNFPDPVFRQYLYQYADSDKNHILTELEWKSVRELSAKNDLFFSKTERWQSENLLKRIHSFEGIEYLGNLRILELNEGCAVKSLALNNPRLTELVLPKTLTEFSIENPDSLKKLYLHSAKGIELDFGEMYALEIVSLENVTADFSRLLQNKNLTCLYLKGCIHSGSRFKELDFSGLRALESLAILQKEQEGAWAESIRFGCDNSYTGSGRAYLSGSVTKKVILANPGFECEIEGDASECEIVYE